MLCGAALWERARTGVLQGRRQRFDGIKRLNHERGRLCLSVRIHFGWISLPQGCLRRDAGLPGRENGDIKEDGAGLV